MQCARKIKILLITVTNIFFNATIVGATPQNAVPVNSNPLRFQKEKPTPSLEAAILEKEAKQPSDVKKRALPLVKVAHKSAIDLLHLFFVPKPMHVPSYTPLLQHLGVRLNWFGFVRRLYTNEQQIYGGGIDLQFCGNIQLSIDIGYACYQPKSIIHGNSLNYESKGGYGLGALQYVMHVKPRTNAYGGMVYGQSRFDLMTLYNNGMPSISKPFTAHWAQLIGGSEYRLIANGGLYGGIQFGIARLLYVKKNDDPQLSNYAIPGYGKIKNKTTLNMTLYLKWSISFLEKKMVI